MRRWLIGGAIILIAPPALVVSCHELETVRSEADQLSNAALDTGVERGWLPAFLLPSPLPFVLAYDLDTNRRCARFGYSEADLAVLESRAIAAGFTITEEAVPAPSRISRFKSCPIESADLVTVTLLTRPPRPDSLYREALAISPRSGQAFYWDYQR
jgi:hypothetical protein